MRVRIGSYNQKTGVFPNIWDVPDGLVAGSRNLSFDGLHLYATIEPLYPPRIKVLLDRARKLSLNEQLAKLDTLFRPIGGFPPDWNFIPMQYYHSVRDKNLQYHVWAEGALTAPIPSQRVTLNRHRWVRFIKSTYDCIRISFSLIKKFIPLKQIRKFIHDLLADPVYIANQIKVLLSNARQLAFQAPLQPCVYNSWLSGLDDYQLIQLGQTRGLPSPIVYKDVVADFVNRQQIPLKWDTSEYRLWVKGWVARFYPPTPLQTSLRLTTRASFECSRADGGKAKIMQALIDYQKLIERFKLPRYHYSQNYELQVNKVLYVPGVLKAIKRWNYLLAAARNIMDRIPSPLPVRVIDAPEKGLKVRVPTCSIAPATILGGMIRSLIEPFLLRDPTISPSISPGNAQRQDIGDRGWYRSLDLTTATDNHTFDFGPIVYEEILKASPPDAPYQFLKDYFPKLFREKILYFETADQEIKPPPFPYSTKPVLKGPAVAIQGKYDTGYLPYLPSGPRRPKKPMVFGSFIKGETLESLNQPISGEIVPYDGPTYDVEYEFNNMPLVYEQTKMEEHGKSLPELVLLQHAELLHATTLPYDESIIERSLRPVPQKKWVNYRPPLPKKIKPFWLYEDQYVKPTTIDYVRNVEDYYLSLQTPTKTVEGVTIELDRIITKRGQMMGDLPSWPNLPLLNKFCWEKVVSPNKKDKIRTTGDDAFSRPNKRESQAWTEELSQRGAVSSVLKDFYHPSYGLYTELPFKDGKPIPIIPLSSLVAPPGGTKGENNWYTAPLSIKQDLKRWSYEGEYPLYLSSLYPQWKAANKAGIPLPFPTEFGGIGLNPSPFKIKMTELMWKRWGRIMANKSPLASTSLMLAKIPSFTPPIREILYKDLIRAVKRFKDSDLENQIQETFYSVSDEVFNKALTHDGYHPDFEPISTKFVNIAIQIQMAAMAAVSDIEPTEYGPGLIMEYDPFDVDPITGLPPLPNFNATVDFLVTSSIGRARGILSPISVVTPINVPPVEVIQGTKVNINTFGHSNAFPDSIPNMPDAKGELITVQDYFLRLFKVPEAIYSYTKGHQVQEVLKVPSIPFSAITFQRRLRSKAKYKGPLMAVKDYNQLIALKQSEVPVVKTYSPVSCAILGTTGFSNYTPGLLGVDYFDLDPTVIQPSLNEGDIHHVE